MQTALDKPLLVPTRRRVPLWWWLAALLAVAIAAYSFRYVVLGERAYVPDLAASFRARPLTVVVHTLFGPLALVLGLVNLLPAMRQQRWVAHRWIGRVYLTSALALAAAGLLLAPHASGGVVTQLGFGILGLGVLATAAQSYRFIRRRNVRQHREWMLRSYGLIFAAVTLRIWMPILVIAHDGQFLPAYRLVAWLCWVPNALFVEWTIRRGWRPVFAAPDGYASE